MPGRDGRGPMGFGSMTGWGFGPCMRMGQRNRNRMYGYPDSTLAMKEEFLEAELRRIRELRGSSREQTTSEAQS